MNMNAFGPAVVNDMVFVGSGTGSQFGTGQQQGVYGLALQRRQTAARARMGSK